MPPRPAGPDTIRPTAQQALDAWAARVRADRDQVNRAREIDDPIDFYGPIADRFRFDPHRSGDQVLDLLRSLARPTDTWLDIGSGAGRYALPLALSVHDVVCVDPSPGMLEALRQGMTAHGIGNVHTVEGRWPLDGYDDASDVALMAHVGYDIEQIGPFLDAMERGARRLCVAVLGEGAMTTVSTLFWQPIHGEPRVPLPAMPELLAVLLARDRLPEVRLAERQPSTFDSIQDLLSMARRQLWVRPGSVLHRRLEDLVAGNATERDGRWSLDWTPSKIGVISWESRAE